MAVRTAATFEKSMNVVGAIVGASGEDFDALRERAKKLGAETVFTAREVAGGMHFMAMSGMEFREVLGGIEQVLRLAAAGQLDMATSADIVTNIMKSQNLTTEQLTRATDVLANAATSSNVSVQQIGESFSYAGAFGLLGNAGVQASRAGAGLRNSLVRLGAPSKKVVNGLRAMGDPKIWTFKNGRRELKNIVEVIAELERVGANTMDMISLLGPRAGEAIGNLVGQGSKALVDLIKKMERSGTAARIAAAAMKGMPGILAELAAAWEAAQIAFTEGEFGEWIQKILKGITWLLRKFADAPPAVKLVIAVLAGLAAILPPLIIAFGFLASGIGAIAAAGVPVLGTIAAITGGIVALIGVIGGLVAYWDKIKVMFAGIGNWIGSFFGGQKIAMGDVALGGGGFNAMSRGAGSLNKTEVAIKVMADEGSTATVERVKNKKGDAKVRVASEGYIGRHVYVGAGA
jgi:TP901 family phage tail tape measure protein